MTTAKTRAARRETPFPDPSDPSLGGLNLLGTELRPWRKARAYAHARAMGLAPDAAHACVGAMASAYERDKPYEAQAASLAYVDLTGHYRLMAALLADPDNSDEAASARQENDPVAGRIQP